MSGKAGYLNDLYVSLDDITYTKVGGLDTCSCEYGREELDDSEFGQDAASAIAGRKLFNGSASGKHVAADAGQVIINAALGGAGGIGAGGSCLVYLRWRPDGAAGRKGKVFLKPAKVDSSVGDLSKFSFSWRQVEASTVV